MFGKIPFTKVVQIMVLMPKRITLYFQNLNDGNSIINFSFFILHPP